MSVSSDKKLARNYTKYTFFLGNKRRRKKAIRFLKLLGEGMNVTKATNRIGVSHATPYNWRNQDAKFKQAWEEAKEAGREMLLDQVEDSLVDHAIKKPGRISIDILERLRSETWGKKDSFEPESGVELRIRWGLPLPKEVQESKSSK